MTDNTTLPANDVLCAGRDGLAAQIVSAYVSNNAVPQADLPGLIEKVRTALGAVSGVAVVTPEPETRKASPSDIKKSISNEALISFIDGRPYKTLKRHLGKHGLTVEQYKSRFGLPVDYPIVAPGYSERRSALAKGLGLGQQRRKQAA